jgi:hypothetical protein
LIACDGPVARLRHSSAAVTHAIYHSPQARDADAQGWERRESEARDAAKIKAEIREEERKARERRALDELAVRLSIVSFVFFRRYLQSNHAESIANQRAAA